MRARPAHRSSKTRPRSWGHCYAGNDKAVRREVGDARSHVNRAQIECGFDCLGLPPHARGTVARPQGRVCLTRRCNARRVTPAVRYRYQGYLHRHSALSCASSRHTRQGQLLGTDSAPDHGSALVRRRSHDPIRPAGEAHTSPGPRGSRSALRCQAAASAPGHTSQAITDWGTGRGSPTARASACRRGRVQWRPEFVACPCPYQKLDPRGKRVRSRAINIANTRVPAPSSLGAGPIADDRPRV